MVFCWGTALPRKCFRNKRFRRLQVIQTNILNQLEYKILLMRQSDAAAIAAQQRLSC